MRVSFATERKDNVSDVEAIWLDRYGNLHEWAGDAWYLLARRLEAQWQMPGGFKADQVLIEAPALGLSVTDPTERPRDLLCPEAALTHVSLRHLSGFVRLCSHAPPFSLATLIPQDARAEQTWLVEADLEPTDLFLTGTFIRPWRPFSPSLRTRPSTLAERVGSG